MSSSKFIRAAGIRCSIFRGGLMENHVHAGTGDLMR